MLPALGSGLFVSLRCRAAVAGQREQPRLCWLCTDLCCGRGRARDAHRGAGLVSLPAALLLLRQGKAGPAHCVVGRLAPRGGAGHRDTTQDRGTPRRTEGHAATQVPWAGLFPTSSLPRVCGEGRSRSCTSL